jgi:hypothetical protein
VPPFATKSTAAECERACAGLLELQPSISLKKKNVKLCPLRKRKGSVSADDYVNFDRLNNNVRLKSWLEITLSTYLN